MGAVAVTGLLVSFSRLGEESPKHFNLGSMGKQDARERGTCWCRGEHNTDKQKKQKAYLGIHLAELGLDNVARL